MLVYFYPRLRQFYRFIAGRLGSSTTRQHQDHLLATWDYFYNSGGWDDYPPQKFVHEQNLVSIAVARRQLLVMPSAAPSFCARQRRALDQNQDLAEYDRDIAKLSARFNNTPGIRIRDTSAT